jgi:hypothetical protein
MGQHWSAENVVSQQLARQLITEQFPDLKFTALYKKG